MTRRNFDELAAKVLERPGAAERIAALRAELEAEIRRYQDEQHDDEN
jgi:hypothetical protein